MPTTLELCEKHWGTRDIYDILNLTKESSANDSKFCGPFSCPLALKKKMLKKIVRNLN